MRVIIILRTHLYHWAVKANNNRVIAESHLTWWNVKEAQASARSFAIKTGMAYNPVIEKIE